MPTVTVDGEKSFEVEAGKKLVLAIEDAGIDIMHRCGGNARCTTCRVEVLGGEVPPPAEARAREAGAGGRPRAQHPALLPDPCQLRPLGRRREPVLGARHSPGAAAGGLSGRREEILEKQRRHARDADPERASHGTLTGGPCSGSDESPGLRSVFVVGDTVELGITTRLAPVMLPRM